ncbi:MAG: thioredoxin domain-containing protein [Nitrosomonas halophila]
MPNRLIAETSPYLLQHADNPVDWHPWDDVALNMAHVQDKPILLSIGYSACHWCHVMAQESFEDPAVAAIMNRHFVNIKVDREERPDLDQIYQNAHYMLNHRSGGWPLTMFLTPEQKPFFGGTYFPKTARYGMPGFLELLPKVAAVYRDRKPDIAQQNAELLKLFAQSLPAKSASASLLSREPIEQAWRQLRHLFDATHGGFGDAPKFLHPLELQFCLRRAALEDNEEALHVVTHTLEKMATGGLYDQLGGGFYRYSTDRYWRIPHFEKMLYDNALLIQLYTEAWLVTGNPLFQCIVEETIAWALREMQPGTDQSHGYYSSLDADSEHAEGKYYLWSQQEIEAMLSPDEYAVMAPYYGLDRPPNFEDEYWHLEVAQPVPVVAMRNAIDAQTVQRQIAAARQKLLNRRNDRTRPGCDEKILTSWNALMIKGMARAGQVFERPDWVSSAMRAMDFIHANLWKNGRLLASHKAGKAHLNAYLDDYAFLLDGLLTLIQVEFRQSDLDFAIELAEVLLNQFEDPTAGGFFFTSQDHEALIHRPKTGHDDAIPTGNGIAAIALQRLGHLLNAPRYLASAERVLDVFSTTLTQHAHTHCSLLMALEEHLEPVPWVILRGDKTALQTWLPALIPYSLTTLPIALPLELSGLPECLRKQPSPDGTVNAWVCTGRRCLPAIHELKELLQVCKVRGKIVAPLSFKKGKT